MFLFLHRVEFYISLLGFIALGLEATVRSDLTLSICGS